MKVSILNPAFKLWLVGCFSTNTTPCDLIWLMVVQRSGTRSERKQPNNCHQIFIVILLIGAENYVAPPFSIITLRRDKNTVIHSCEINAFLLWQKFSRHSIFKFLQIALLISIRIIIWQHEEYIPAPAVLCCFYLSGPFLSAFCAGVYCIDRRYSYHVEPRYRGTVWGGLSLCDLIDLWLPSQSSCSNSSLSQWLLSCNLNLGFASQFPVLKTVHIAAAALW